MVRCFTSFLHSNGDIAVTLGASALSCAFDGDGKIVILFDRYDSGGIQLEIRKVLMLIE